MKKWVHIFMLALVGSLAVSANAKEPADLAACTASLSAMEQTNRALAAAPQTLRGTGDVKGQCALFLPQARDQVAPHLKWASNHVAECYELGVDLIKPLKQFYPIWDALKETCS
jgi:hypothetical protein